MLTPIIAPGRRLIKRGTLIRSGGEGEGAGRKPFEFLLLSDYLLWLEREEMGIGAFVHDGGGQSPHKRRVSINALGGDDEEKWWCRGHMSLVDMEVILVIDRPNVGGGGEEKVEVLSPEGSFALYCGKRHPFLAYIDLHAHLYQIHARPAWRVQTVSALGWIPSALHVLHVWQRSLCQILTQLSQPAPRAFISDVRCVHLRVRVTTLTMNRRWKEQEVEMRHLSEVPRQICR